MARPPRHASEFDAPALIAPERVNPLSRYLRELDEWWRQGTGPAPQFSTALERQASAHDQLQLRLAVQALTEQQRQKGENANAPTSRYEQLHAVITSLPRKWMDWDCPMHKGGPSWLVGVIQTLSQPKVSTTARAQALPLVVALMQEAHPEELLKTFPTETGVHPWVDRSQLPMAYGLAHYLENLPVHVEGLEQLSMQFAGQLVDLALKAASRDQSEHWRIYLSHSLAICGMRAALTQRDEAQWKALQQQLRPAAPPLPIHRPWGYLPVGEPASTDWIGEPEVLLGFFASSAPLSALALPETAGASFTYVKGAMERRHQLLGQWPKMPAFMRAQSWLEKRLQGREPALVDAWKVRLQAAALEQAVRLAPPPAAEAAPARRRM